MRKNKFVIGSGVALLGAGLVFSLIPTTVAAKQHALLIGIGKYEEVGPLAYAVNDMKKMKAFFLDDLGGRSGNITELVDHEATRANILGAFSDISAKVNKGDHVLVYYSGHGTQVDDQNGDEGDGQDEALVSFDSNLAKDNVVLDDEIDSEIAAMEARGAQVVMITDACHSGSISRGLPGTKVIKSSSKDLTPIDDEKFAQRRQETPFLKLGDNRVEWSAASPGQLAYENGMWGGGIFTEFFLKGLKGKSKKADANADGVVSNSELIQFLQRESDTFCKQDKQCSAAEYNLTPVLTIAEGRLGEAVFPVLGAGVSSTPSVAQGRREQVLSALEQSLPLSTSNVLSVSITEGSKLSKDDEIFIKVKSKKAGYLLLLDLNAKGELVQIFPNDYHEDNKILAGNEYYVPENNIQPYGVVAEELGTSHIYAIVTHDKIDVSDITGSHKDLTVVNKPALYASKISARLNEVWRADDYDRMGDYSVARFDYWVE